MQKIIFLMLIWSQVAIAQNALPYVQINNATLDTAANTILINYDATDLNSDLLEVKVFLSADSGKSYLAPIQQLTGAVGFPVTPGVNKNVVLTFHPDSLLEAANGNTHAWFMVKLVATDNKPIAIENMIPTIDSNLVLSYMQYIAQPRHHITAPQALSMIKDSIEANFALGGLQTQRSNFNYGAVASQNILGRKPGHLQERSTIIVDAHFDAVANSPGADDNGSALAALLIASKVLSPYNFEKTLQFIGFDKEENGLIGSLHYINNSIPSYQETEAVLNMEMIGYYNDAPNSQLIPSGFSQLFPAAVDSINSGGNQGVWLFTVGNTNSSSLSLAFDTLARNYVPNVKTLVLNVPGNGQIAPDLRRSDHAPFWDAGYKALMLTDGADYRNSNYHTPGDSLGTLNFPYLVRNIKAVTAVAAHLAKPISVGYDHHGAWQLIKDIPFSINANQANINVELYPNPLNKQLFIRFDVDFNQIKIELKNISGKVVLSKLIQDVKKQQTILLPIHNLEAGVYFISGVSANLHFQKKLIVTSGHQD